MAKTSLLFVACIASATTAAHAETPKERTVAAIETAGCTIDDNRGIPPDDASMQCDRWYADRAYCRGDRGCRLHCRPVEHQRDSRWSGTG